MEEGREIGREGRREALILKSLKTLVSGFGFYKIKNVVGAKLKLL